MVSSACGQDNSLTSRGLESACLRDAISYAPKMFPATTFKLHFRGPGVRFADTTGTGMDVVDYALWPPGGLDRVGVRRVIQEAQAKASKYAHGVAELWLLLAVSANGWTVSADTPIKGQAAPESYVPDILGEFAADPFRPDPYTRVLIYEATTRQVVQLNAG